MSAPTRSRPAAPPGGPPPGVPAPRTGPWWSGLLAPLGAGVAVLLAGIAVGSAVQGGSWFGQAALTVAVVVVSGTLLLRVRPWLVAPGQLVALILLVTIRFTDRAVFGVLPGPGALRELGALLTGAAAQIDTGVAPVPASPEILLLVMSAFGILTITVFGAAVTLEAPAVAGVPLLCVFAVPAALDAELLPWWSMLAAGAGFAVLLLLRGDRLRLIPGGAAIAALAVVVALLFGSAVTAVGTAGRLDGANGSGADGSIGLNPFTSLRGQLSRSEPRDLFAVSGLDQPVYLRALTLQTYVPQSGWQAGRPAPGVPLAGPLPPATSGPARTATAQVRNLGFRDYWLPVLGDPISITGPSAKDWSFDAGGGIAYSNRPRQEDGWTEQMRLPVPSAAALRAASGSSGVDPVYLDTAGVAPKVTEIAKQVTARAGTPFDRAMALNEYFSGPDTQFRYSLATAPGAGGDALVEFLTRGRTGYCEQFASAMAVMLRTVGVPARVAVGFTAGTPGPDGRTITTNDAHAWVEAWFPGYGWTTFDPTPLADGRTVEPQYVTQARAEESGASTPADPGSPARPDPPSAAAAPPQPEGPDQPAPEPGAEQPAPAGTGSVLSTALTVLAVLLVAAVLGLAPMWWRRRQGERRLAAARAGGDGAAAAAWDEVLAVSRDHGVPARPGDTVRATAEHLAEAHGLDDTSRAGLHALADRVEAAWYGGLLPGPGTLEPLVRDVRAGITAGGTPLTARILPPSVLPAGRAGRDGRATRPEPAGTGPD